MKILDAKDILTLSIEVTEEINPKNLLDFLRNSLLDSRKPFSKNTFFSFSYIEITHTYEVVFYEKDSDFLSIEPALLSFCIQKREDALLQTDVLYTENYFTLFIDNILILFKPIDNGNKEDMKRYIEQIYKIEEFTITYVAEDQLKEFQAQFLQNKFSIVQKEEYPLFQKNSFRYFLLFILCGIGTLCLYLYEKNTFSWNEPLIQNPSPTVLSQSIATIESPPIQPINTITKLFEYLVINKVTIDTISYANSKIYTVLYSKEKKNILNFIAKYNKDITITSWNFSKRTNTYSLEVIIEV